MYPARPGTAPGASMNHGSHGYFIERARFERRVSALSLAVSCALLGMLVVVRHTPPLQQALNDPTRFGFEGPERFVRRIEIQSSDDQSGATRKPSTPVLIPETRKGGGSSAARTRSPHAEPDPRQGSIGVGDATTDALAQALRRAGGVPVFQSTELVIDELVRPDYPAEAREKGLEGKVAVMALVDTVGRVVGVELLGGEQGGLLERASSEAVWRCRFKPYRISGEAREVYAVFRFSFHLY